MALEKFHFRSVINYPAEQLFEWHLRSLAIQRRIPPWEGIEPLSFKEDLVTGEFNGVFRVKFYPFYWGKVKLKQLINKEIRLITIRAEGSIFSHFEYTTKLIKLGPASSEIIEGFSFVLKHPMLHFLQRSALKRRFFRNTYYKHQVMSHDVEMLKRYTFQKPLRILISGSHGLLGSALYYYLNFMGHEVYRLERKQQKTEEKIVMWDSISGRVQLSDLENFDAVINLSGENIGKGRWTKKKKDKILKSRATITENLACAILKLKSPPKLFINASAVGFYGSKGNDAIPENSPPGKGMFISEVCQHWERAARELEERGIRVVLTRFGAVLSPKGGMLKKFLLPFQLGLGGKIGSGKQFMSWITIDDLVAAVYHILMTSSIKGAVNIVSPQPIRNEEFAKALAKKIKRWQGPPLPIFALKLFFGQKGEELFLASIRAYPEKLIQSHFDFHYPSLQQAFDHLL